MRGRTVCVLPRCSCVLLSRDIILAPVVEMLSVVVTVLCCFARTLHAHTRWVHVFNAGYSLRVSPLSVRTNTKRKRTLSYLICGVQQQYFITIMTSRASTMNEYTWHDIIVELDYTRCMPWYVFPTGRLFNSNSKEFVSKQTWYSCNTYYMIYYGNQQK